MDLLQVNAYLKRLKYSESPAADENTLQKLVRAHLERIPFENIEVYDFQKVPSLEEKDLFEKIVVQKRGGYCFELNTLFCHLLQALGFSAYPVLARVLWNKETLSPPTHMGIVVCAGEKHCFCDVGYGGPGPKGLLYLEETEQLVAGEHFKVSRTEDGDYRIDGLHHGEWKGILCFKDEPVRDIDFLIPNFYCARNEKIMFAQKRLVNVCTPSGSKALTDMELTVRNAGNVCRSVYANREELEKGLLKEFGIRVSFAAGMDS